MGFLAEQWQSPANAAWAAFLAPEIGPDYFEPIEAQLQEDYSRTRVYPAIPNIFRAFVECPPDQLKVVLLGQDPYFGPGQAEGLAFSFMGEGRFPPSLRNIVKELALERFTTDEQLARTPQKSGKPMRLDSWARQGVFLLNCSLTVREGEAGSHMKFWKPFTDLVIDAIAGRLRQPVVHLLWGNFAKAYAPRIAELSQGRQIILTAPHPSPLSRGFLGNAKLREANEALQAAGRGPIAWESILHQE